MAEAMELVGQMLRVIGIVYLVLAGLIGTLMVVSVVLAWVRWRRNV